MLLPNLINSNRILECEMVVQMVLSETYLLPILLIEAETFMQSSINLVRMYMASGECVLGLLPIPHGTGRFVYADGRRIHEGCTQGSNEGAGRCLFFP